MSAYRFCSFLLLALSGCAQAPEKGKKEPPVIEYSTADGSFSYVVTPTKFYAGFGPMIIDKNGVVGADVRQIRKGDMHCMLVGEKGDEISLAIERPTRMGAAFECANTKFDVIYCNGASENCANALIRSRYYPPMKHDGAYLETLYFYDRCRGILSFMDTGADKVEPGFGFGFANELRGYNGILADESSADCRREREALAAVGAR